MNEMSGKELNAQKIKKEFEEIYRLWENVSPIDGDCGTLCSAACCRADGLYPDEIKNPEFDQELLEEDEKDDLGIYLLPGEELVHDQSDGWLTWYKSNAVDAGFPESWTGDVYYVKCRGPEFCRREKRPIQCRTYPVAPYITEKGELKLILNTDILPYKCPLVHQDYELKGDFIKATYSAWKRLIQDKRIFDLVEEDSRFRDECGFELTDRNTLLVQGIE